MRAVREQRTEINIWSLWAQVLAQRLHFNTFGGNPVCAAGGRAVLRAIDEDGVQANSAKVSSTGWYLGRSYCYNRRC